MSITYGFFNGSNGDRKYNADQMSEYFDGLVSNGVYENVGGALQVLASQNMEVNVQTGRAIINSKWVKNDAVLTLEIAQSHPTLNRYTAVVARLDIPNRLIEITTKDGTPASEPLKPTMQNDSLAVELCLAYILVKAGATSISQVYIEDMRSSNLCGWVTGLIDQVDTSTLFLQWQTAYEEYYSNMTAAFDNWFSSLTEQLNVNTFIQRFTKEITIGRSLIPPYDVVTNEIELDMEGYIYDSTDIFHVYVNGLNENNYMFDVYQNVPWITVPADSDGTKVFIEVLKSKVGFEVLQDQSGNNIVLQNGNDIEI